MSGEAGKPTAAIGHMPFAGHRTVAQVWEAQERRGRHVWPREMTDEEREADARDGSARLCDAIRATFVPLGERDAAGADNPR